jgi:hypothetical protein
VCWFSLVGWVETQLRPPRPVSLGLDPAYITANGFIAFGPIPGSRGTASRRPPRSWPRVGARVVSPRSPILRSDPSSLQRATARGQFTAGTHPPQPPDNSISARTKPISPSSAIGAADSEPHRNRIHRIRPYDRRMPSGMRRFHWKRLKLGSPRRASLRRHLPRPPFPRRTKPISPWRAAERSQSPRAE